jgi:hypothetical protein
MESIYFGEICRDSYLRWGHGWETAAPYTEIGAGAPSNSLKVACASREGRVEMVLGIQASA